MRALDILTVPHETRGKVLVLRDPEGVASTPILVPAAFTFVLGRFDGRLTCDQIAVEASRAAGQPVEPAVVARLAEELDEALMLETPRVAARRRELVRAFAASQVRPAHHAGGAYHQDAAELARYLEVECLAKAPARRRAGALVGLCAPHMDLWRAAVGYGHAYRALAEGLGDDVDTFVLLGTCHAGMRRPFAVCEKAFETPLGRVEVDHDAIDELRRGSRFDIHEEEYLHKVEHSLEFQAVFLRHVLDGLDAAGQARGGPSPQRRRATIVPILCGLGDAQARRRDPSRDLEAESFLRALTEVVARRTGRVVVIAGADLAHVGPRFGDATPLDDPGRSALRARDGESVQLAVDRDASGFFAHVAADLRSRRVCGLAPIYSMLRALPEAPRGDALHYAQCVDAEEGSIVSHASLAFYAPVPSDGQAD